MHIQPLTRQRGHRGGQRVFGNIKLAEVITGLPIGMIMVAMVDQIGLQKRPGLGGGLNDAVQKDLGRAHRNAGAFSGVFAGKVLRQRGNIGDNLVRRFQIGRAEHRGKRGPDCQRSVIRKPAELRHGIRPRGRIKNRRDALRRHFPQRRRQLRGGFCIGLLGWQGRHRPGQNPHRSVQEHAGHLAAAVPADDPILGVRRLGRDPGRRNGPRVCRQRMKIAAEHQHRPVCRQSVKDLGRQIGPGGQHGLPEPALHLQPLIGGLVGHLV